MSRLYLVGIDIGNPDDLTLRASEVLTTVTLIVGETYKAAGRLKKRVGATARILAPRKDDKVPIYDEVLTHLKSGESAALVSDAGMPVWDDPGLALVRLAIDAGIPIEPISGVSSALAALVCSGMPLHRWAYWGFLPLDREVRKRELMQLNTLPFTTILMETPHRLRRLLEELTTYLCDDRQIALCWQLTMPEETVLRGTPAEVSESVRQLGWRKGEFIVVIEPTAGSLD